MFFKLNKITIILLSILIIGCSPLNRALRRPSTGEKYESALDLYKREQYNQAIVVLDYVLPLLAGDRRAEEAYFYYAYCHYYTGQYLAASDYFKEFYRTYRRSVHAEEALFMGTFSLYQSTPVYTLDQSLTVENINNIQRFINLYPSSKFAPRSNRIIQELLQKLEKKHYHIALHYEKVRQYKSAVIAYTNYLRDYPNSSYKEEVYFRRFKCQYHLANLSLEHLKAERFQEAINLYYKFIDRYSNSTYLNNAENIYRNALSDLEKAKNLDKKQDK